MSHLSQAHVQYLYQQFGELKVLDDIIRHRAADDPPAPILAYPRAGTVADYEYFTGRDLDQLIDGAAKRYLSLGLSPVRRFSLLSKINATDMANSGRMSVESLAY